jgi:hypothetical protein
MAMTQKDFLGLEGIFNFVGRQADTEGEKDLMNQVVYHVANYCEATNDRFKRESFYVGCGQPMRLRGVSR